MPDKRDLPFALRPADTIAVVLPSGPPDLQRFDSGVQWLSARGYNVRTGDTHRVQRYLAGSDDARLAELVSAYRDHDVRALYCARGGYGAMRILARFFEVVASAPAKLVIGFSDVTALGCALWRVKVPWLHAPLLTTVAAEPEETQTHLLAIAAGEARGRTLTGAATIRSGKTAGRLIGGSLSLLAALCGTPFMPDLRDAILFIEDIGEKPYRLDRMWTQLVLADAVQGVAGVIVGSLTQCDAQDNGRAPAHTGLAVLSELVAALNVPAASGFAFGHEAPNFAVPFGARARFDADSRIVTIDEEIVY